MKNFSMMLKLCVLLGLVCVPLLFMACVTPGGNSPSWGLNPAPTPAVTYDRSDTCQVYLQRLHAHGKYQAAEGQAESWTKCMSSCYMDKVLGKVKVSCADHCKGRFNSKIFLSSFIKTSDAEKIRLQKINREIANLQRCRDAEARQIMAAFANPNRRAEATAKYENYKEKVKKDNEVLDALLAQSGERIQKRGDMMKKIDPPGEASDQLMVKAGFNVRDIPSAKNSRVIGKTKGRKVAIYEIQDDWVSIQFDTEPAYVHVSAFPSISQQTRASVSHASAKKQHKATAEKKLDYEKVMDENLKDIDEASRRS